MERHWTTCIAAMAAILALSACSFKRDLPSAGEVVDLGAFIDGKPFDEFLADKNAAQKVLIGLVGDEFGTDKGLTELRRIVDNIDQGKAIEKDVPAFRGMAGMSAVQFAQAILFPNERRKKKGLIGDFLYDKDKNSGHLTVDTRTEIFRTAESYRKNEPDSVHLLQWHVYVLKDGFEVRPRMGDPGNPDDPFYPDNPFPDTVEFPDFSTDPSDPRSIWARGLNRKLWAKGKKIVVRDIFQKIDDGPIVRLPDNHQFYKSSDESCIDLMVRTEKPDFKIPAYRIEFPEQSGYCLGRCGQPDIYNSM